MKYNKMVQYLMITKQIFNYYNSNFVLEIISKEKCWSKIYILTKNQPKMKVLS